MRYKSARQFVPGGRNWLRSYDSGYEHSVERMREVRQLIAIAESESHSVNEPAQASEEVSAKNAIKQPRSRRRSA